MFSGLELNPEFIDDMTALIKDGEKRKHNKEVRELRSRGKRNIAKNSITSLAKDLAKRPGITFFDLMLSDSGLN